MPECLGQKGLNTPKNVSSSLSVTNGSAILAKILGMLMCADLPITRDTGCFLPSLLSNFLKSFFSFLPCFLLSLLLCSHASQLSFFLASLFSCFLVSFLVSSFPCTLDSLFPSFLPSLFPCIRVSMLPSTIFFNMHNNSQTFVFFSFAPLIYNFLTDSGHSNLFPPLHIFQNSQIKARNSNFFVLFYKHFLTLPPTCSANSRS